MGKIYAVTAGYYSDYHIVALSTDKDKADRICKMCARDRDADYAQVEEYEDAVRVDVDSPLYEVTISNQSTTEVKKLSDEDKISVLLELTWRINQVIPNYFYNRYSVNVVANSEDKAIKIARDLITEYKAGKEGII